MRRLDFIADGDNFLDARGLQFRVVGEIPVDVGSFKIELYQTNSDPTVVNKYLGPVTEVYGTLRDNTSIVNPVIRLALGSGFTWNFCYIPSFGRYYFITDVISVNLNYWEIHLKCDVLMSFQSGILSLNTRVSRSQMTSIRNVNITDTLGVTSATTHGGRYTSTLIEGPWTLPRKDHFVDDVLNSGKNHLLVKIACTATLSTTFISEPATFGYIWATMDGKSLMRLINYVSYLGDFSGDFSISDLILDIKWIPTSLRLPNSKTLMYLTFGSTSFPWWLEALNLSEYDIRYTSKALNVQNTAKWRFENLPVNTVTYKNFPPFKTMALDFAPFGTISLKEDVWGNKKTIDVICYVDTLTGDSELFIADPSTPYRERIARGNVGYPINISHIYKNERSVVESIAGAITGVSSGIIGSFITSNPLPALTSSLSSAGSLITGLNPPPQFSNVQGRGEMNANFMGSPEIITNTREQYEPNPTTQGYLCNKDISLSNVHGFAVIASGVHIEGNAFAYATKPEVDEIESLLMTGVILP